MMGDAHRSPDHDFGCRLTVLVDDEHRDALPMLDAALEEALPDEIAGFPVRFPTTWDARDRHKVDLRTVHDFAASRLGFDPRQPLQNREWLCLTGQSVLEVIGGPVFHDTTEAYRPLVSMLDWYSDDLCLYVLAAGWQRINQELPFVGRAGEVGDETGSRLISARLCRDLIHLAFTASRAWMPYPKWSGTALAGLDGVGGLRAAVGAALDASDWRARQAHLVDAIEQIEQLHRTAGIDLPTPTVMPFFERPVVTTNDAVAPSLLARIDDDGVRSLPLIGAIEQWSDNVDLLSSPARRAQAVHFYGP